MMHTSGMLALQATLPGLGSLPAAASAPAPGQGVGDLVLKPCTLEGVVPPAECGTLRVREDRTGGGARWIELKIVRLGPTGPAGAPDPLLVVLGGPVFPLVAVAPGRFRAVGFLGTYFRFETDADGARSPILEQPGTPPLHLEGRADTSHPTP